MAFAALQALNKAVKEASRIRIRNSEVIAFEAEDKLSLQFTHFPKTLSNAI